MSALIPASAVEAAHKAWRAQAALDGSIFEYNLRAALEAAAPYMQTPVASDLEDQDDLAEILKKERWKYVAMTDEDGRPDGGYFEQSNDDVARAIVRAGFRKVE